MAMTNEKFLMMLFNCDEKGIEQVKTIAETVNLQEILEVIRQCGMSLSLESFLFVAKDLSFV